MARDPSKKQPNVITDPNLEEQIRCRAYELYEQRDQKTVMMSTTGSALKRRLSART